jgi:Tfp pilus assembly protein PilX
MILRRRLRRACADEHGFAIIIAVALMALVTIISLGLMTLAQGEDSHSRRDLAADDAYQAAEAGTDAYLSDLTESNIFWSAYMAKGEATRWDSGNNAHSNDCSTLVNGVPTCTDKAWSSGSTWTYKTARASDVGWYTIPNTGYQYLIQVYPPNASLSGLAEVITRIDVTGRPTGSADVSRWKTIETQLRPSSLSDFEAFTATNLSYASGATTTGPVFVGQDNSTPPVLGNLSHSGVADANLYAEGTVTVGGSTLQNGAKKYDSTTSPTALCKVNNCTAVQFTTFASTFTTVAGAASAGGITLGSTDTSNPALSGQSPAYHVDAWKLAFQSNGTVIISSCKKYTSGSTTYDLYHGSNPPVCGDAKTDTVPSNGAIYSAVDVLVSGVVKGKVTVATAGNVIFGGNTTYNTNGVDVLGVEATGSVIVAQWAPDSNHNITIYSAEFALNGLFERDPDWTGSPSGTMNYYGSTAVYGSNCGQSDCTIIFSDFFNARNYNYDPNLLFVQPPFWPTLGNAFTILTQRPI